MEGYLEVTISTLINIYLLTEHNFEVGFAEQGISIRQQKISRIACFVFLIIVLSIPLINVIFMHKNIFNLQCLKEFNYPAYKEMNDKYGTMFEGLHLWRTFTIFFNFYFMLRRFILAFAIVWLHDYPYFQLMIIL